METTTTAMRIAVVGGGISGVSLTAILSRSPKYQVSLFERAPPIRDEGYGLDFDENGQTMLKLAGVWDKYWTISRPRSDIMKFYVVNSENPFFVMWNFLSKHFPSYFYPTPESNRAAFRDVILDVLKKNNVPMTYNCKVTDLKETPDGVELRDDEGKLLGTFDLVVDASGVHSPLRHYRVDDPIGKVYSGKVLIHGVINDPETTCPPSILEKLGQGTYMSVARGHVFVLQRFGADPDDHRTAFFYHVKRKEENSIFEELGIERSWKREQGILRDESSLKKIKDFLHKETADFNQDYHIAIDALDRLTVRPEQTHGTNTQLKKDLSLPIVCIGDSLRNIGLGGGGTLASADVLDLYKVLEQSDGKKINMKALREAEEEMLKRRHKFWNTTSSTFDYLLTLPEDPKVSKFDLSGGSLLYGPLLSAGQSISNFFFNWDKDNGVGVGSLPRND